MKHRGGSCAPGRDHLPSFNPQHVERWALLFRFLVTLLMDQGEPSKCLAARSCWKQPCVFLGNGCCQSRRQTVCCFPEPYVNSSFTDITQNENDWIFHLVTFRRLISASWPSPSVTFHSSDHWLCCSLNASLHYTSRYLTFDSSDLMDEYENNKATTGDKLKRKRRCYYIVPQDGSRVQ